MLLTSMPLAKQSEMFSVAELRIIRHVVGAAMEHLRVEATTVDAESDRAVELSNDLMIYRNILEKIAERGDV